MTDALTPGSTFDVVIEIPRGSRNKYEYDHHMHVIRLRPPPLLGDRVPVGLRLRPRHPRAFDGDPLDVLVLLEDPTFPGCWVEVRAVGVFWMEDEKGPDAKILCVLSHDPNYDTVHDIGDLPQRLLDEIEHFFDVYKMLAPEKNSTTRGYEGRDVAYAASEPSSSGSRARRSARRAASSSSWVPSSTHAPVVDHDDAVGAAGRGQAVGDQQRWCGRATRRPSPAARGPRWPRSRFDGRLVEQQDRRVHEARRGPGPGSWRWPAESERPRSVTGWRYPSRQRPATKSWAPTARAALDLGVGGVGPAVGDVVADGAR